MCFRIGLGGAGWALAGFIDLIDFRKSGMCLMRAWDGFRVSLDSFGVGLDRV